MEKVFNNQLDRFRKMNYTLPNSQDGSRNEYATCRFLIDSHEQLTK